MTKKILIVEDEKDLQTLLQGYLVGHGHEVIIASSGEEALDIIQQHGIELELAILDWMLPGVSGIEICRFIRLFRNTRQLPILMLTALSSPDRVIEGLDAGADDYLAKPYDPLILEARVKALIRRSSRLHQFMTPSNEGLGNATASDQNLGQRGILKLGTLTLDVNSAKVKNSQGELSLTLSEFRLLQSLLENPGKVLTRMQLMSMVQGGQVHVTARTIDTHIFGLRKKMGDDAQFIETIRGIGYRVIIENERP